VIALTSLLAGCASSRRSGLAFSETDAYGAIWDDLTLNAAIGNGNDIAGFDWYYSPDGSGRTHHIRELKCSGRRGHVRKCHFLLLRDPSPDVDSEAERRQPPLLSCRAFFHLTEDEGWRVSHLPSYDGGHTRTTMVCHADKEPASATTQ
jgi:hypothetical protein